MHFVYLKGTVSVDIFFNKTALNIYGEKTYGETDVFTFRFPEHQKIWKKSKCLWSLETVPLNI